MYSYPAGSTVPYVVDRIVQQGLEANKGRVFVPTGGMHQIHLKIYEADAHVGFQSKELIVSAGLSLGDVDQNPIIDVTIDGADECVFRSIHSLPLPNLIRPELTPSSTA